MKVKLAAFTVCALALGACAPKPAPEPVYIQPTFDKLGNVSCPAGYAPGTAPSGATVCSPIGQ